MMLKRLVLAGFSALLLSTGFASAVTCDAVSGATMCMEGSTNNDKQNPLQVNIDEIFGIDDWVLVSKDDSPNGEYSVGDDYNMYMVVLKGPRAFNYQAYKVDPGTSGTYSLNAFGDRGQETSHASIYGAGSPAEVPLPASGFLILAGLGGLVLMRKRSS